MARPAIPFFRAIWLLQKTSAAFGLQAYPNPSNGEIQIDINLPVAAKVGLRLMDLQGRILQAQDLALPGGESKIPLDFSGQASGVYLLRVETGNGAGALMVVKR